MLLPYELELSSVVLGSGILLPILSLLSYRPELRSTGLTLLLLKMPEERLLLLSLVLVNRPEVISVGLLSLLTRPDVRSVGVPPLLLLNKPEATFPTPSATLLTMRSEATSPITWLKAYFAPILTPARIQGLCDSFLAVATEAWLALLMLLIVAGCFLFMLLKDIG